MENQKPGAENSPKPEHQNPCDQHSGNGDIKVPCALFHQDPKQSPGSQAPNRNSSGCGRQQDHHSFIKNDLGELLLCYSDNTEQPDGTRLLLDLYGIDNNDSNQGCE